MRARNHINTMQFSTTCCNLSLLRCFCAVFARTANSLRDLCPGPASEFAEAPPACLEDVMFDKPRVIVITLGILFLMSWPLSGQQTYVTQFDAYGGYGFLNSSKVDLFENGFAAQFGFRPTTWLSLGFDYTVAAGNLKITPSQLLPALQTQLQTGIAQGIGAGLLPLPTQYNYAGLYVPAHSDLQSEDHAVPVASRLADPATDRNRTRDRGRPTPSAYPIQLRWLVRPGTFQDRDLRSRSGACLPALQESDDFCAPGLCGDHP